MTKYDNAQVGLARYRLIIRTKLDPEMKPKKYYLSIEAALRDAERLGQLAGRKLRFNVERIADVEEYEARIAREAEEKAQARAARRGPKNPALQKGKS